MTHHRLHLHALVLLALLFGCKSNEGPALPAATGKAAPPPAKIPTLEALEHESGAPTTEVGESGTGTLRPRHEAALGPKETGLITQISVDEGDRVKKGQVLFRLDAAQAALAVDQAKAALATAEVQAKQARTDFERTKALAARGSATPDMLDQVTSRLDAAESGRAQAKAALGLAQRHAANMVVTAPFAGVVTERRMNVGETATLMPPSVVLVLQDIDALELRARLPEAALKDLRVGSEVGVHFPSIDESRRVRIKRISPTVDARTRTIEIVADVDNRDHRLLSGMLVEIAYGEDEEEGAPTQEPGATEAAPPAGAKPPEHGAAHDGHSPLSAREEAKR